MGLKIIGLIGMIIVGALVAWYRRRTGKVPMSADERTRHDDRELIEKLEQHMREDEPWRDPELDLTRLAGAVGVGRSRLSRAMNRGLGRNFHQYINDHRVEAAKAMLLDSGSGGNVDDVAHRVGFNARSAFYQAFEERVGQPPGAYRSRVQARLPGFED